MASITIWSRLEPRCRYEDLESGLEARTFDPLWLLARQWQMGEMLGDDAGSPIAANVAVPIAPLDRIASGGASANALAAAAPLEAQVEREGVRPAGAVTDYAQSAEAGLAFVRMLRAASAGSYVAGYVAAYPIAAPADAELAALDPAAARAVRIMAGRAPDGVRLANDLRSSGGKPPATPAVAAADAASVGAVCAAFIAWYAALVEEPLAASGAAAPAESTAWDDTRMEYAFALDASTAATQGAFGAARYTGAPLSWTTFDRSATGLGAAAPAAAPVSRTYVPSPVSFKGMPARRFWELEDAAVDLGDIEAGPADLGRLMLREFALVYGNDWYVVPLMVPAPSVAQIASLTVNDTFGIATNVPHYSQTADGGRWRMFAVTGDVVPHRLLLVPAAARGSSSDPIERVVLMRDEAAMMAWGVERIVTGASGRPVDRSGEIADAPPPPSAAAARYLLGTEVAAPYVPYVPGTSGGKPRMLRAAFESGGNVVAPRGRLLAAGTAMFQEEFAREGVAIERRYRLARGSDGATHLWLGRRKRIGASAPAAGLSFDDTLES